MSFKNDIQATRFTAASGTAIIAQPIRLRGIFVSSNGGGAGSVVLNTEKKAGGTNLFGKFSKLKNSNLRLSLLFFIPIKFSSFNI